MITPASSLRNVFANLPTQSKGIVFIIISVTFFSLMDALAKRLGQQLDVSQILWARYGGQLVLICIFFAPQLKKALNTETLGLQILRGLLQLSAAGCFFTALKSIGLAEATAVADLSPVIITLGAGLFLGEKVGIKRIMGVFVALLGALIIIRPGGAVFSTAALWPLGTAFSLAAYSLITRKIGKQENVLTPLLYSGIVCTLITSTIIPFRWVPPGSTEIVLLVFIGGVGTMGQLMMIRAYATSEASSIAPFVYAGLLTATLWGMLFFGDFPDFWTILGALVIAGAGLYVWHRERKAG